MVSVAVDPQIGTTAAAEQQSPCATADENYTCSACGSTWAYQTVRNTGRCPACGDGLRRTEDPARQPTD
jgi:rubrerythrin